MVVEKFISPALVTDWVFPNRQDYNLEVISKFVVEHGSNIFQWKNNIPAADLVNGLTAAGTTTFLQFQ